MVLVIESTDDHVIDAFSALAKALKVEIKVEPDASTVSLEERQRRVERLRKFKGGLKKYYTGYEPNKHDWYQQ